MPGSTQARLDLGQCFFVCVCVVVVVVVLKNVRMCVYPQHRSHELARGVLDGEELFVVEGSKTWRSTPGQPGGARKMTQNASKKPITAPNCNLSQCKLGVHQIKR